MRKLNIVEGKSLAIEDLAPAFDQGSLLVCVIARVLALAAIGLSLVPDRPAYAVWSHWSDATVVYRTHQPSRVTDKGTPGHFLDCLEITGLGQGGQLDQRGMILECLWGLQRVDIFVVSKNLVGVWC